MFRTVRLSLVSVLVFLSASLALACGGMFLTEEEAKLAEIAQHGERIIFTVDGDDNYTAILGIDYVGSAKEFSWILPVPSIPEVDVVDKTLLDGLQNATHPHIIQPDNPCRNVPWLVGFGGGGNYLEYGQTGPYEFAIIKNDSPDEMLTWLRDNGYVVSEAGETLIKSYAEEGMYFVAMKLRQDADAGDIQPVRLKYQSSQLRMAMRLTSVAAVAEMPLYVWIFADTQYVPENFAHPAVDYSRFKARHTIGAQGLPEPAEQDYQAQLAEIQQQYNGLAFVTEYAQSSDRLNLEGLEGTLIEDYARRYPYLTRLRAQMSPDQMTVDPVFVPAPDADDVAPTVNLMDYHDPLHYWGCSTRDLAVDTALIPQIVKLDGLNSYYSRFNTRAAIPEDWQLSQVTAGDTIAWLFAPGPVNADTLSAFLNDEPTPPMLLAVWLNYEHGYGLFSFLESFGPSPAREETYDLYINERISFEDAMLDEGANMGWTFVMLTSQADYDTNQALYRAMLDYGRSYDYYLREDLRFALFLGDDPLFYESASPYQGSYPMLYVGFPDGWVEHWISKTEIVIAPEGDSASVPYARLLRSATFGGTHPGDWNAFEDSSVSANVRQAYGLPEATEIVNFSGCGEIPDNAIPYTLGGRRGYVRVTGDYLLEVSAPEQEFDRYQALLESIAASLMVDAYMDC